MHIYIIVVTKPDATLKVCIFIACDKLYIDTAFYEFSIPEMIVVA